MTSFPELSLPIRYLAISRRVIWAELSKVSVRAAASHHSQPGCPCQRIRLWKCVSGRFSSSKQGASKRRAWTRRVKCRWLAERRVPACHNQPADCEESYRGALRFHRPSSALSSRNSELQRRCPRPGCFLWREDRQEHNQQSLFPLVFVRWNQMICRASRVSFIIVTLKVNDGDPGHAMPQYIQSLNRKKKEKERKKGWDLNNWLQLDHTYPIYCSVLLNFLARYLADALLGILTMDSSLP